MNIKSKRRSLKKKTSSKQNYCYTYKKKTSPKCNRYKNCIWIPKQGCTYTTNKSHVKKQVQDYQDQVRKHKQMVKRNNKALKKKISMSRKTIKGKSSKRKTIKRTSRRRKAIKRTSSKRKTIKRKSRRRAIRANKVHALLNMKKGSTQVDRDITIIKQGLIKKTPDYIHIDDNISIDINNDNYTVKDYNIPIHNKLITLDKKRHIVFLNNKALLYFSSLVSQNNFEIGGKLDFNLDELFERATTRLGASQGVVTNIYDYEVPYHTHPLSELYSEYAKNVGGIFNTPSVGDINNGTWMGDIGQYLWHTVRTNKYLQQCNIVFSPDGVYVWYYSQALYKKFKAYKDSYSKFTRHFFKLYNSIFKSQTHRERLYKIDVNNYWIHHLKNMGVYMYKFIDDKYTYGLNWNVLWDNEDSSVKKSISKIHTHTVPKIMNGEYIYPNMVPLYIVPIEPIDKIN